MQETNYIHRWLELFPENVFSQTRYKQATIDVKPLKHATTRARKNM